MKKNGVEQKRMKMEWSRREQMEWSRKRTKNGVEQEENKKGRGTARE